jgi:hypothetical protein
VDPERKAAAAAVIAILVIGSVSSAYYLNTSSVLASQEQTISALQSTVSSLVSHTVTSTTTATITATTTSVVSTTAKPFPQVPYDGIVLYATNADGCSGGYSPCFSSDFSQAYVFTCATAAATPQGCTVQINSTKSISFIRFAIWFPYMNQSAGAPSWANCAWNAPGGSPSQFYAVFPSYCIPIGVNAFIMTMQHQGAPP